MQQGGGDGEYIQDGLVFWLDGINKGAIDGSWVDLIGGVRFENHGAIITEDGFRVGYSMWLEAADPIFSTFIADTHTIEVVVEDLGGNNDIYNFIFSTNYLYKGICLTYYNYLGEYLYIKSCADQGLGGYDVPTKSFLRTDNFSKKTISLNEDFGILNTQPLNEYTDKFATSYGDFATIGCRYRIDTGYSFFFYGVIKCIRIYNRKITQAEMIHNQQVDNERFNLGL